VEKSILLTTNYKAALPDCKGEFARSQAPSWEGEEECTHLRWRSGDVAAYWDA
jgi:hypothetical protein